MNHSDQEDAKVKEILHHLHSSVQIPNGDESWRQMQAKLQRVRRRKTMRRRLQLAGALLGCSLVVSILMNAGYSTAYAKIASLFKKVQGEIIEIFHESPNQKSARARTSTPADEAVERGSSQSFMHEKMTVEEAVSQMAFPLIIPSFIPEEFTLDSVFITKDSNGMYNDAYLEYYNDEGELLKIRQQKNEDSTTPIKTNINSDSGEFKEVFIGEYLAILFVDSNGGFVSLEWLTNERIQHYISGPITTEEIIKIGMSLN